MVNFNGVFIEKEEALVSCNNRSFKYADGIFETMKAENSKIWFFEDHYFRLMASMRMLRMEIPMEFTMDFIENEILKTLSINELENARIRLTVFRNEGGLYTPETNKVSFVIETSVLNTSKKEIYRVDLFKDYYVYSGLLSTIKTTQKLTNVLAGIYATENNLENCILLNEKKHIVEAINGNIFVVKDNKVKTPSLSEGCIKGVVRKKIIEILRKKNYTIEESEISPFELQKADEVFLTNSIVGIQPITNYRKKVFSTNISNELNSLLYA